MKYKFDSMGRFVDYEFVVEFVEEFLPTLITYKGFITEDIIDEVDESGNIIKKGVPQPLTYRYLEDEIELNSLNGYPFIEQYFFNSLSTFFAPVKYDKLSEYKPIKYLNNDEICILDSIGIDLPLDLNDYDPDFKTTIDGKKTLYNPFYSEHTKEQVAFLLDNLSALLYMLDLILNNLKQQKDKLLEDFSYGDGSESLDNFKVLTVKHSILSSNSVDDAYKLIKKELLSKYKKELMNKEDYYIDYLINYHILNLQINFIYPLYDAVKENHSLCKKLELIKTREIFSVRFSNLLMQKSIDTPTVLAWLGITPQTLSDYKRSKTLPDTTKLIILSKNLGVSIDYLLGLSNLKDHRLYPAFESFKNFGFTPESFDTLYYSKKDNPWAYAHLITTLNLLLEEDGMTTLTDITNYITHRLTDDYYTLNTKTVQELEDSIIRLLDFKTNRDIIKNTFENFKNNLPLSSIDNLDASTLLSIQQDLIKLKSHTIKNTNLMEEHIMPYFEKLWLENDDVIEEGNDFIDSNHTYNTYNDDIPF